MRRPTGSYRSAIYICTAITIMLMGILFLLFAMVEPGDYYFDIDGSSKTTLHLNAVLATLLLAYDVFMILSLVEFIKIVSRALTDRVMNNRTIMNLCLALYPTVLLAILTGVDIEKAVGFLMAPLQIIRQIMRT